MKKFAFRALLCVLIWCCLLGCTNNHGGDAKPDPTCSAFMGATMKAYQLGKILSFDRLADSFMLYPEHQTNDCILQHYGNKVWIYYIAKQRYDSALLYNDSIAHYIVNKGLLPAYQAKYINVFSARGEIFYKMENFDSAYANYFKAKAMAERSANNCAMVGECQGLGMVCYRQKKFREACYYFLDAFNNARKCDDGQNVNLMQEMLDNAALSYQKTGMADSALFYYDSTQKFIRAVYRKFADSLYAMKGIGVALGNIGTVYYDRGQTDSALKYFEQSYAINIRRSYEQTDAMMVHVHMAQAWMKQGKMDQAADAIKLIDREFDTIWHTAENEKELDQLLYTFYKHTGNLDNALKYHERYSSLQDSIAKDDLIHQQADIDKSLKQKKQGYDIELLQKQNKLNSVYLWVSVIGLLMAIVIIGQVYLSYRRSRQHIEALTELNNQVTAQKSALEKKNQEKDRILHVVAHDLRNPVGGIQYLVTELQQENADDWKDDDVLGMMQRASNSALTLINELLGYTTDTNSKLTLAPTNIGQLADDALQLLRFKASEKRQTLRAVMPSDPIIASVNAEKITRVIHNLLGNAMKFSNERTEILLRVEKASDSVRLSIRDHGIGIPESLRADIFEMFTNARRHGTTGERSYGLGLSICKQIVELHNGRIWFESEEGSGTTFFVELPLSQ